MFTYGIMRPLNISDLQSLNFVINTLFMKLFKTNVIDTFNVCQDYFAINATSTTTVVNLCAVQRPCVQRSSAGVR